MNGSPAITALSYMPVPTIAQAAALGTAASVCMLLFHAAKKIQPTIPNYSGTTSYCLLVYTAPLTCAAATQQKLPLLSRLALLGTSLFTLKLYAEYITLSKQENEPFPLCPAFYPCLFVALGVNLITTGILLYQEPFLARAIHFAGSLVLPIRCFMFSR